MVCRSSTELLVAAVVAAAVSFSGAARADGEADAEAFLRRGVELRKNGHDAEALDAFKRANAASPSARASAQAALAEQALNLWLEAEKDLSLALGSPDDPWIRQHRATLDQAARVISGRLAWISVQSNMPGATIYLNGRPLGRVSEAGRLRVLAGETMVELREQGREPVRQSVQVPPEASSNVTLDFPDVKAPAPVEPPKPEPPPAPSPPPPDTGTSGRKVASWVAGGMGVVAIGVGSVFGVRAMSLKSERDDQCRPIGCTQKGVDADRDGRTAGNVATIGIVAGIVALGVGLVLVLTSPSAPSRSAAQTESIGVTF